MNKSKEKYMKNQTFVIDEHTVVEILLNWCDKKDLTFYDTALTNHITRKAVAKVLVAYSSNSNLGGSSPLYLSSVHFNGHKLKTPIDTLRTNSLSVTKCDKDTVTENMLITLIDSCPTLTSLHMTDVESLTDSVILLLKNSILHQLIEFSVIHDKKEQSTIAESSIDHMAKHCRSLQSFVVQLNEDVQLEQDGLLRLFAHNPHIEHLYFRCGGLHLASYNQIDFVRGITESCRRLKYLHLLMFHLVPLTVIADGILLSINTLGHFCVEFDIESLKGRVEYNRTQDARNFYEPRKSVTVSGISTDDTDVVELFAKLSDLQEIKLLDLNELSGDVFADIARHSPDLREVSIVGCKKIDVNKAMRVLKCDAEDDECEFV